MASYFDATDQLDLAYLPARLRSAEELTTIAAQAEADVLRQYTSSPPGTAFTARDGWTNDTVVDPGSTSVFPNATQVDTDLDLWVWLRGYTVDADDVDVNANLKQALRETIADVIAWRIRAWHRDPSLQSESVERGKSKQYRQEARDAFPPGWDWRLQIYDTREPGWGL